MTSIKLVFACFLASSAFSFEINLEEIFKDSPCKPSQKQVQAYQECTRDIFKKDELNIGDGQKKDRYQQKLKSLFNKAMMTAIQNTNVAAKLGPCAWNKLGIFVDSTGFNSVAFKKMIEEMPVDDSVRTGLRNIASQCLQSHTGKDIMKCIMNEKIKICNF